MQKTRKKWFILAASLIVLGLIMFAAVMVKYSWDFTKLSTKTYETNTHTITTEFSNISINTDTADITFLLSDTKDCKVICYEETSRAHSITVEDDTLIIKKINNKAWYNYIEINFNSPKITVYLPKAEYDALLIEGSTGDVEIPNAFSFESIDISLSTGDINLRNVNCKNTNLNTSTGDINLTQIVLEEKLVVNSNTGDVELNNCNAASLNITTNTGDVELDSCDAANLNITTDTGDVTGSLLSEKTFKTSTDTGDINVPNGYSSEVCKISTNTGDIEIKIAS